MNKYVPEIYSKLSDIETELTRRRNDPVLMKKIHDFFGDMALFPIPERPFAMLSRTLATPNKELEYFLDIVSKTSLQPLVLEYNGKFVAKNPEKYFLCKLHFCHPETGRLHTTKKVVDFNVWEGKHMHHISTKEGESLVSFHKKMLKDFAPADSLQTIDFTEWFNKVRTLPQGYYFYFLSLCIVHGVLFENYLFNEKEEEKFFIEKIWPSFTAISTYFGVKPLIYPLLPITHESKKEWLYYQKKPNKMI